MAGTVSTRAGGTPRFSVVVPTRNRLAKLRRALASLERQGLRDFELLLVDDGSTDGTGQYLREGRVTTDFPGLPRTRTWRNEQGVGAASARNQALEAARGQLVAFLDDDDEWMPEYLQGQSDRFDANPGVDAICARHLEFDEAGKEYRPDPDALMDHRDTLGHLLTESFVHTMSVLAARRAAFEETGPLDPSLSVTHDWDWVIRLLMAGGTVLPPDGPVLVRHEIPGGLVTRLREWYGQERAILRRVFESRPERCVHRDLTMAYRHLLFARLAFQRGEHFFGLRRLFSAFATSPRRSLQIIGRRLQRNRQLARIGDHE